MANKASKKQAPPPVQSPVQLAHVALLPLFIGLQKLTTTNVALAGSRSAEYVRIICALQDTSADKAADAVTLFGDGLTKVVAPAVKINGSLVDALMVEVRAVAKREAYDAAKAAGKPEPECIAAGISASDNALIHVNVRSEISRVRTVFVGFNQPNVRETALKSGIRAAYTLLKPKAKPEADTAAAAPVAKPAGSAAERAAALLQEPDGWDACYDAMRSFLLRAADSIGVSKLAEIEMHMMAKKKKVS